MKKVELVREFSQRGDITTKKSRELLSVLQDILFDHIEDEDGIKIFDAVTFKTAYKNPRKARNPRTGESIEVPGKYVPKVVFGKQLKEYVNR